MFYVTKGDLEDFTVLGYLSKELAKQYQPEVPIYEDNILAMDMGFNSQVLESTPGLY